jgi:hypothetical protein
MVCRRRVSLCLLGTLIPLVVGCAELGPFHHRDRVAPSKGSVAKDGVFADGGGVVLTGSALSDGDGTLLGTMKGKIPSFRVQQGLGMCPEISLRGMASFSGFINPDVYVDGTRATDTCVLETLSARDVARVEVYPMGFTMRPGYRMHSEGLILVFLR